MERRHEYRTNVAWTGNLGAGTRDYRAYSRDHDVGAAGRPSLAASSDPLFRGDATRWNPELLLVASLSQCHMLWYLHLAAINDVVVVAYVDDATGVMVESGEAGGRFVEVVLRPRVTVAEARMVVAARGLHTDASARCFIASSVRFPVRHEPVVAVAPGDPAPGVTPGS